MYFITYTLDEDNTTKQHPAHTKNWQYLWDFNKLLYLLVHHVSINFQ